MVEGTRLPVLGVLGGAVATAEEERVAERVGELAARAGWVVLTGGGSGVMAAASRGAVRAGGLTVGILPTAEPRDGYPNPWVRIPLFTGAGSVRNAFNVLSSTRCVAIGGGAGTASEIALAVKAGVPVWSWRSWRLTAAEGCPLDGLTVFDDAGALLVALEDALAGAPEAGGHGPRPPATPHDQGQEP